MKTVTAATNSVRIYMAGPVDVAEQVCREYCYDHGDCVTVTPTSYVYKGGTESGFIVGFINYPRFPRSPMELKAAAETLAVLLMDKLRQQSFTIEAPEGTTWYSRRES